MSLMSHDEDRSVPGPTRELIRGSPVPVKARDDEASSVFDAPPPPPGSVRKFTMEQFQHEFGPCHTYSAPASPMRKRPSFEASEIIPSSGPYQQPFVQPTLAAAAAASAASPVPATLGRGGWRPVTGQFSLDSPSFPRRRVDGDASTLPLAQKPLSSLDNLPADQRAVKFSESVADEPG